MLNEIEQKVVRISNAVGIENRMRMRSQQSYRKARAGPLQTDFHTRIAFTPHTLIVYRIFVYFWAVGCPKVTIFPREDGYRGMKPFGRALGSLPKKVHKYSVKAP